MAGTQLAVIAPHIIQGAEDQIAPGMARIEEHPAWPLLSGLSMTLAVRIPLKRFKVRELLAIEAGQILTSEWAQTKDVPVSLGNVILGWSEFDVAGDRIGVRIIQLI